MLIEPQYMVRALELALKGGRSVAPNPMVGAVLAYEGAVIGEGYHQRYGGPHAEVAALSSVEDRSLVPYSTLYVTLEPCAHFGKTPPCADLIIDSGIKRVVVGCRDPFPQVSGLGIERLINAGISVTEGVMELECRAMNRRFIVAQREKRPYCILKWAQTRDGFIARTDLSSRWISSAPSRTLTHLWRSQEMAILVGRTTAAVDDPELTVRHAIISEEFHKTLDSRAAIRVGIRETSRTITSAALIMISVFLVAATLELPVMKQLGIGLAAAVLIDATLIRTILLPATMVLLGRANWYLPKWLQWLPRVSL